MNIESKIAQASDLSGLVLYKEGIFYKLYNQHAMFFVTHIRSFKVGVKFIKKVSENIYSIGFPIASFDRDVDGKNIKQLLEKLSQTLVYNDNEIVCKGIKNSYVEQLPDYDKWCAEQEKHTNKTNDTEKTKTLSKKIMDFNLGYKTPMQAMNFISELQHEIAS